MAAHAELRQRKSQKDIDAVHDHQELDVAMAIDQKRQRREAHKPDAVSRHQLIAQVRQPVRRPGIERHVGKHPRAVEKAGLCRHDQKRSFGDQRDDHQHCRSEESMPKNSAVDFLKQTRVESFSRLMHDTIKR